jgi:hypothetical protein
VNRSKTQKKEWVAQPNLNVGMNVVEHRLSLLHSVSGFFFFFPWAWVGLPKSLDTIEEFHS